MRVPGALLLMSLSIPSGALFAQTPVLPSADPASIGLSAAKLAEAGALLDQYVADGKVAGSPIAARSRCLQRSHQRCFEFANSP